VLFLNSHVLFFDQRPFFVLFFFFCRKKARGCSKKGRVSSKKARVSSKKGRLSLKKGRVSPEKNMCECHKKDVSVCPDSIFIW
jgi:hypothetical protein